jgi:hypothetical protein
VEKRFFDRDRTRVIADTRSVGEVSKRGSALLSTRTQRPRTAILTH